MSEYRFCIAFVVALALGLFVRTSALASSRVAERSATTSASAEDVTITQNDLKRTIDCKGAVRISGNRNTLTLTGECSSLLVDGNDNVVTVEAVAEIATWGNRNTVTWTRGVGGKPPKISDPGTKNSIKKSK
jgi:hypothetical protein